MREKPESLSAPISLTTPGGRVLINFRWHQDRFVQRIFVDGREAGQSIDGDAQSAWPPSPPVQQLSIESIDDAMVALGVGAAGRGHWSISVEAVGDDRLRFDLACRCGQEFGDLGSTYQLGDHLRLAGEGAVEVANERLTDDRGTIWTAKPIAGDGLTQRWAYRIEAT